MTEVNPIEEFTEAYIKSLNWSDATDDYTRTLVAGNLRTFAYKLEEFIKAQDARPLN